MRRFYIFELDGKLIRFGGASERLAQKAVRMVK
jgi:hypothetical protein